MKILGAVLAGWMLALYTISTDSTESGAFATTLELMFGAGAYTEVVRDCNGNITDTRKHSYVEGAAAVTQQLGVARLRLSGGKTDAPETAQFLSGSEGGGVSAVTYLAPAAGLHDDYFGVDLGYLFIVGRETSSPELPPDIEDMLLNESGGGTPQGRVRIGREDRTHFSAQYAFELPASAGAGACDLGLGFNPGRGRNRYWVGLGLLPDEALLAGFKGDLWITPVFTLALRGHVALSGDAPGYGGAIGTRIRF